MPTIPLFNTPTTATNSTHTTHLLDADRPYADIAQALQINAAKFNSLESRPLVFTAGTVNRKRSRITKKYAELNQKYFGARAAQHMNCACCKNFLHQFGAIQHISPEGKQTAFLWDPEIVPDYLKPYFVEMKAFCESEKIRNFLTEPVTAVQYYDADRTSGFVQLGVAEQGGHPHLHVDINVVNLTMVDTDAAVEDRLRDRAESHEIIVRTLTDKGMTADNLRQVIAILTANEDRSVFIDRVGLRWWQDILELAWARGAHLSNVAWAAMAAKIQPSAWRMRTTSVWEMFNDLKSGFTLNTAFRRFHTMTRSTNYQRATTEASNESILRAAKIVEDSGIAPALERRTATLEDLIPYLTWAPRLPILSCEPEEEEGSAGIFSHLLTKKGDSKIQHSSDYEILINRDLPPVTMTWDKFTRSVLPQVKEMWVRFDGQYLPGLIAFMAPVHEDAKPILAWDNDDERCPISWYMYADGASLEKFNARRLQVRRVLGIMPNPSCRPGYSHPNVIGNPAPSLIVEDLKDVFQPDSTLRLFPEIMKSSLKQDVDLRRVIENFSNSKKCEVLENRVAGITASVHGQTRVTYSLLVSTNQGPMVIRIDRND